MKKWILLLLPVIIIAYIILDYYSLIPKKSYVASDFSITTIVSPVDYNQNGIDDYQDILNGALQEAKRKPKYVNAYYNGGYPPDNEGVCTDLIWRALKEAGYLLKDMVTEDIKNNREAYPNIIYQDSNIDFRRVINLDIFLKRNTLVLTNDLSQISEWQPGDIVVFGNQEHIGIISNKRNRKGIPYLIHNAGQPKLEEDTLERWNKKKKITGHYRFFLTIKKDSTQ